MRTQQFMTLLLVRLTIAFVPNAQPRKYRNRISNDKHPSKLQTIIIYAWDTEVDLMNQSQDNIPKPLTEAHKSISPFVSKVQRTLLETKETMMASIATRVAPTKARAKVIFPGLPELPQLPDFKEAFSGITELKTQAMSFLDDAAPARDVILPPLPKLPQLPKVPNFEEAFSGITNMKTQAMKFLEKKSRPKRKPVSMHSIISTIAAGSYLTAYLPFLHPGLDHDGFLQIFDFYQQLSIEACHQIQFGTAMLALSGILGYFRIPPKAPLSRRLPFTLAAFANTFFALMVNSSLNALPEEYYQFDAFSGPGMGIIAAAFFGTSISMISILDNAISGSTKGIQSLPGATSRGMNILFAALIYSVLNGAQIPMVVPVFFSDLDAYHQSMSAAFESVGMASLHFQPFATAAGFPSFLSFAATLQFEKKISETMGTFTFLSLFLVFNYDAILATYKTMACPDLLPISESSNFYISNLLAENHLVEGGAMITGLVVLNAVRKLLSADRE